MQKKFILSFKFFFYVYKILFIAEKKTTAAIITNAYAVLNLCFYALKVSLCAHLAT